MADTSLCNQMTQTQQLYNDRTFYFDWIMKKFRIFMTVSRFAKTDISFPEEQNNPFKANFLICITILIQTGCDAISSSLLVSAWNYLALTLLSLLKCKLVMSTMRKAIDTEIHSLTSSTLLLGPDLRLKLKTGNKKGELNMITLIHPIKVPFGTVEYLTCMKI